MPSTASGDYDTSAISLYVNAAQSDAYTQVTVGLAANDSALRLTGGDAFVATMSGHAPLTLALVPDNGGYLVQFDGVATSVSIAFTRSGRAGAPSSTITFPPIFTLAGPTASLSRSVPMTITWDVPTTSTTTYTTSLAFSGPCIAPFTRSLATDVGTYTLQPADLFVIGDATAPCDLDVELTRDGGSATWDAALGVGSSFVARQVRRVTLHTTP